MADSNTSKGWASSFLSYVTGTRKRTVNEADLCPQETVKRARLEQNSNETKSQTSFTSFNPNNSLSNSNIFNNTTLTSTDIYPNSSSVIDLRSKIKAPSRTKTILSELSKLSSSSNSFNRPLYLLENSKWIDTSSNNLPLPPRRSSFTPSRVQQISANMNKSARSDRSFWRTDSSYIIESSLNGSISDSRNQSRSGSVSKQQEDDARVETTFVPKKTTEKSTNRFGLTNLDDIDEDELFFTFDPPDVRGPKVRKSVSPSPTESSSKSETKRNFDSDTSVSAESDQETEKDKETKSKDIDDIILIEKEKATVPAINLVKPAASLPGLKGNKWSCPSCMVNVDPEKETCPCCSTPNQEKLKSTPVDAVATTEKKWECPTCMVFNQPKLLECPCCQTPKPGSKSLSAPSAAKSFKPQSFSATNIGISFGTGSTKDISNVISKPPETATNDSNGFSFGIGKPSAVPVPKPTEEPIKPVEVSTSSAPPFEFGLNNNSTVHSITKSITPLSSIDDASPAKTTKTSLFNFESTTTNSNTNLFSTKPVAPASLSNSTNGFSFGASTTTNSATSFNSAPVTPGFNFGTPIGASLTPAPTAPAAPSTGFNFGGASNSFNFGGENRSSALGRNLFGSSSSNGSQPFLFGGSSSAALSQTAGTIGQVEQKNMFAPAPAAQSTGRRILNAKRNRR